MTHAAHRLFAFDTEFDASGEILFAAPRPVTRRAYAPAEVEALVAQARAEARDQALDESDSLKAMALAEIAQSIGRAAGELTEVAARHRREACDLALAVGRTLSGQALDRFPQAVLAAAIEQLAGEMTGAARLVIRTEDLDEAIRAELTSMAGEAGFVGTVVFRPGAGARGAFALEWADGRADFDPAEVARRIDDVVTAALAGGVGEDA